MSFGQPAGPPATYRQLEELRALLHDAGYAGFREARGPMGFTQRQAGGKFTRDEAEALIARLRDGAPAPAPAERLSATQRLLREMPDEALAAELQRRGWIVVEP